MRGLLAAFILLISCFCSLGVVIVDHFATGSGDVSYALALHATEGWLVWNRDCGGFTIVSDFINIGLGEVSAELRTYSHQ